MQISEAHTFTPNIFVWGMQEVEKKSTSTKKCSDYYAFGLQMPGRSSNSANPNDAYKFTGHERDEEAGLNLDYMGVRMYDPASVRFLSIDPYAAKYPNLSLYVYVANNPLIFIDPDGKEIRAINAAAQRMILNTLPKELRKHVVFNDEGYIDRTALNKTKSESGNFSALQQLVNDDRLFNVDVAEGFSHKDGYESFGEITMGDPSEAGAFSPQTGEQGWMGITLVPGDDAGYGSDGDYINIVVNSGLSEEGRAQNFSHEGYGHAYLFSKGKNPNHVVINVDGVFKDTNRELADQIIRSIIETILNMEE